MAHAVGVEVQDLVHEIARLAEIAGVFESRACQVQLFDAAVALALLDERLTQSLMGLGIIRIIRDTGFELLDPRCRRRLLDVREHERACLIPLRVNLINS